MKPTREWTQRARLLALEFAVILPALALVTFSIMHLKSLGHDKTVNAAIERDLQNMLLMTDKQMASKVFEMGAEVRNDFPQPGENVPVALHKILETHPYVAHVFYFDQHTGTVFASQPGRMGDADFRQEREKLVSSISTWLPMEGKEIVEKLWKMDKQDGRPYMFDAMYVPRRGRKLYQAALFFPIKNAATDRVTIGGFAFDAEYLRDDFFPGVLNFMADCPTNHAPDNNAQNRPAFMIHPKHEVEAMAESANWDGGKPEVEHTLEAGFPGLVLATKYHGTSIQALSSHFLQTSYLILGCLTIFMVGGIVLSYRSVSKEVALAKLKSDFVSNVSHELRTPLSLIRLYAETLEMGRLNNPDKYQEYYRIIRKESERLTTLINNILDFSKIEAGKKDYDFRETDVAELVRTTLDSYRYQIEQNGFAFEESIEENLPKIKADREAIARSLLNLVNNAVKYSSSEKSVAVRVSRRNGSVNMEVIDKGIGIPRPEQEKIFEKFYRVSDPLVHNTKGSGLGLSLVRHVVDAHGGRVWVESVPGKGSKFSIELPIEGQAKSARAGAA
ncbi:MAG TPA: HAMP domain-containing sensor histidine kinase [Candidatus Saccharimonadales bacterium]|nr:HAMP domain-containing sensor histidine kinase [Candidatus Saccharimonadales bacterium]